MSVKNYNWSLHCTLLTLKPYISFTCICALKKEIKANKMIKIMRIKKLSHVEKTSKSHLDTHSHTALLQAIC